MAERDRERPDPGPEPDRRSFLKGAVAGSAAAAAGGAAPAAFAQTAPGATPAESPAGYQFFRPAEASFIEALVDHMVPADRLGPQGSELGVNIYIEVRRPNAG